MPLRLSRRAGRDLDDIYNFGLDRWGEEQAESYLGGFWQTAAFIEEFPLAVRVREEVDPPIRGYRYKAHLILYDVNGDHVVIQRVANARSDWVNDAR